MFNNHTTLIFKKSIVVFLVFVKSNKFNLMILVEFILYILNGYKAICIKYMPSLSICGTFYNLMDSLSGAFCGTMYS